MRIGIITGKTDEISLDIADIKSLSAQLYNFIIKSKVFNPKREISFVNRFKNL